MGRVVLHQSRIFDRRQIPLNFRRRQHPSPDHHSSALSCEFPADSRGFREHRYLSPSFASLPRGLPSEA